MKFQQVYEFIIPKLEHELPAHVTFHNSEHINSVISSVEHLAKSEGITSASDITILKTAALFHDVGFLKSKQNHEEISCEYAQEYLPNFEYSSEEIKQICKLIMATKMPQTPLDKLSMIICDADLYYLGANQYYNKANSLFLENQNEGSITNKIEWVQKQIKFLENHSFFTDTARRECNDNKLKVLSELKNKLKIKIKKGNHLSTILIDVFAIIVGVFFAAVALKGFLVPNHFFDGGITGISLLTHEITHANLALILFLFNLPFIIVSYFIVSPMFAYKTLFAAVLLGVFLILAPSIVFTQDKLLVSIFGGVCLGLGVGIVMRAGGALDGIEVLALYTLKKTSFTITEIILGINILIFSIAAFKFGIETALYSVLTYFCATRTIDYVIEGIQAFLGVTIVSGLSDEIKYLLVENLGRGITVYKGERGYLPGKFEEHHPCDLIFTVITRLELRRLKNLVHEVDPKAFIFVNSIKETAGGILKRTSGH
jgi:uncharacterized membrane-anchored protein YitT (DUF2179 family)/predicted metal-dependent HD superfamily phosphohydrolase